MPRKAFVADLQEAVTAFERVNVSNLKAGEEDGMICLDYQHDGAATEIIALVPDLGDYPVAHLYMFYTKSEQVDPLINKVVDDMSDCTGMKVADMLTKLTKSLDKATAGSRLNPVDIEDGDPMIIDSDGLQEEDFDEEEDGYDSDDNAWSQNPPKTHWSSGSNTQARDGATIKALNSRIRSDLSLVKQAGFRVGHLGSLLDGGQDSFVTISIRVAKLGISEEALDAWHMDRSQYFILLIRYSSGYQTIDSIMGTGVNNGVQFRVGLYPDYKLAIDEAIAAFTKLEDKSKTRKLVTEGPGGPRSGLGRLFIGRPLDELLNDRLIPLLRYRMAMGFPWGGAEEFLSDHQGRNLENNAPDTKYWAEEETVPGLGTDDHLMSNTKEKSFPLLAMQFSLRHLVRCTEFCLVCHCKIEADFEALKPYVCSKPLCLYQYMSLGFGPSIEHEIITQPHVVDLLISFCYTSASFRKLRYLPTGMALMVPTPDLTNSSGCEIGYPRAPYATGMDAYDQSPSPKAGKQPHVKQSSKTYKARFDRQKMELIVGPKGDKPSLQPGSWISMSGAGVVDERWHCRVIEALHPAFRLSQPVVRQPRTSPTQASSKAHRNLTTGANIPTTPTPAATPPPAFSSDPATQHQEVEFVVYDLNFDDLDRNEKQGSIVMLLDTLPTVKQMKDFLLSKGGQEASLRAWADRCSPAALGILRWIIASNRSCVVQVDSIDGGVKKSEERVSGMPDWMQFRFAQGAPDKEQRFMTSVRNTTPDAKHPTMFAWHGSPLHNWHGIVREGLHFERTDHGRAFGHGVYHALDVSTSLGYSSGHYSYNRYGNEDSQTAPSPGEWPQSHLRISQALALNEIVNAPAQFVSKSPHLVVAQLDWIQSRYLFVKCNIHGYKIPETTPTQVYAQDPSYQAVGSNRTPLILPLNAVSKSRRPAASTTSTSVKNGNKKARLESSIVTDIDDTVLLSDDTDIEDLAIFFSDAEGEPQATSGASKGKAPAVAKVTLDNSQTDFEPGKLEATSLQLLEPPAYATPMATRALQRELTSTLKVQDSHPAHELGWYINPELMSNVYQWIVELHSFETHLPLAKDMKSKDLKSVVLEIRFGKEYPMSPPFVRILRPRFLSFMQGGGGHVTAGGALCMELLTNSGWSAVSNIESVLLQVRLAMSSTDPKPARLEPGPVRDYKVGEAVEAFVRACNAHGWEVPKDFRSSHGSSSNAFAG